MQVQIHAGAANHGVVNDNTQQTGRIAAWPGSVAAGLVAVSFVANSRAVQHTAAAGWTLVAETVEENDSSIAVFVRDAVTDGTETGVETVAVADEARPYNSVTVLLTNTNPATAQTALVTGAAFNSSSAPDPGSVSAPAESLSIIALAGEGNASLLDSYPAGFTGIAETVTDGPSSVDVTSYVCFDEVGTADPANGGPITLTAAEQCAIVIVNIASDAAAPTNQQITGTATMLAAAAGDGDLVAVPDLALTGQGVVLSVSTGSGSLERNEITTPDPGQVQGTSTPTHAAIGTGRHRVLIGPIGGQPTDELRIDSVTYIDALNAPGSATIVFPFAQATLADGTPIITAENLAPERTAVWIMRDDALMWAGMLWGMPRDFVGRTRTLIAAGWLSYFRKRFFETDQTFTGVDQFDIARQIIDHAQAVADGDVAIDTSDTALSGVTRDRTYLGAERKFYGEALEQLAAVDNGFDFRFEPSIDPTTDEYNVSFRPSYPATGRETEIVLYHGVNCVLTGGDQDGSASANSIAAIGAGQGNDLLIATATDPSPAGPLLQDVTSYTDVTVQATLDGHATRDLARRNASAVTLVAQMIPGALPALGTYRPGDRVRVVYPFDGFESFDRTMRILTVTVADDDGETVTIELGPTDPWLAPDTRAEQREMARRVATLERARRTIP
ncbi:MAG: hypothetical protein AAGA37_19750 [Actinomycetota bacterium]